MIHIGFFLLRSYVTRKQIYNCVDKQEIEINDERFDKNRRIVY